MLNNRPFFPKSIPELCCFRHRSNTKWPKQYQQESKNRVNIYFYLILKLESFISYICVGVLYEKG